MKTSYKPFSNESKEGQFTPSPVEQENFSVGLGGFKCLHYYEQKRLEIKEFTFHL